MYVSMYVQYVMRAHISPCTCVFEVVCACIPPPLSSTGLQKKRRRDRSNESEQYVHRIQTGFTSLQRARSVNTSYVCSSAVLQCCWFKINKCGVLAHRSEEEGKLKAKKKKKKTKKPKESDSEESSSSQKVERKRKKKQKQKEAEHNSNSDG